jgi:hypothetical protein
MPAVADRAAWVRLGKMLEQRRVCLDPRYSNLSLFAEERGINYRMAWDAEQAKRINYRRATRLAIDIAYGWAPGSVDAVLAGGEPAVAGAAREPDPELVAECRYEQRILASPEGTPELKKAIIRAHRREGHDSWCKPPDERAAGPEAVAGLQA